MFLINKITLLSTSKTILIYDKNHDKNGVMNTLQCMCILPVLSLRDIGSNRTNAAQPKTRSAHNSSLA